MIIKTTDTRKTFQLSLRLWRSGWNCGYGPDCFADIATDIPEDYAREVGGNAYLMTQAQLDDIVTWWTDEARNASKGKDGDGLCGLTPDAIENGDEWGFFCDEI